MRSILLHVTCYMTVLRLAHEDFTTTRKKQRSAFLLHCHFPRQLSPNYTTRNIQP